MDNIANAIAGSSHYATIDMANAHTIRLMSEAKTQVKCGNHYVTWQQRGGWRRPFEVGAADVP